MSCDFTSYEDHFSVFVINYFNTTTKRAGGQAQSYLDLQSQEFSKRDIRIIYNRYEARHLSLRVTNTLKMKTTVKDHIVSRECRIDFSFFSIEYLSMDTCLNKSSIDLVCLLIFFIINNLFTPNFYSERNWTGPLLWNRVTR